MSLDADAVEAQEAYRKVVTYFGETSKTMPPETFFPMFDRFIKAYGKAETDLEKWNLLQQKNLEKREQVSLIFGLRAFPSNKKAHGTINCRRNL